VYFKNHAKYTDAICGQNAVFNMVKQVVHVEPLGFRGLTTTVLLILISLDVIHHASYAKNIEWEVRRLTNCSLTTAN
jgi:hypothetical protein